MVDANENDDVAKSESTSSPEKDEAPLNSLSNMEEEEDEDEDDEEYEEEEEDEEEEGDDEEEPEEEEEEEEEEQKVDNGANVVNNKEPETNEEEKEEEKVDNGVNAVEVINNEEPETNKENSIKEAEKKPEEKSKSKEKRRKAKNKKTKQDEKKESVNGEKPEPSNKKKGGSKRVESMGMVFMCSSKTKADCFRYKILGLPENRKDQVLKIYKGMRLFLFDVDLRLMYGIFKAAGPGGYNIEPRAFKSEFPSQVRFTVLDDCVPLAEENFKHVIKENYYTRNKFESLLKSDQVKKLCKLFVRMGKGGARPKSTVKARRTQLIEPPRIRPQETSKRRARDEERRPRPHPRSLSPPLRETRRYTDYDYDHPRVLYNHEPPLPIYHPAPPYATYERAPLDIPSYVRPLDRDPPYPGYTRDPPLYRDNVYTLPPEHHLVSRDYNHPNEYHNHMAGGSRLANYRDAEIVRDYPALPLPDYRSRPRYRY